ncbi:MAG: cytochrome P450 [Deltaproteobacteria bacterium]|nr:cytochrome P450 [Deltaproteobacteria bacterium]
MGLPPGSRLPKVVQTAAWVGQPLWLLERTLREFGPIFSLSLAGMGDMVLVATPEAVRQVFTGDPAVLHAGQANELLRSFVGSRSILLLDGPAHARERKLLMPPFHGERMTAYAEAMREATEASLARWPLHKHFPIQRRMQDITLAVIVRTVFGISDPRGATEIADLLATYIDAATDSPWRMLPAILRIDPNKLLPWAPLARLKRRVDDALLGEIRRRRAHPVADDSSVLGMLIDARDEDGQPMTEEELHDELITLLVAGHETTATSLSWAFDLLLEHPAVLARVRAELEAQVGRRAITAADLARLPYLDATIREVLRIHPVVPMVARKTQAPFEVAGFDLPVGTYVCPSIRLTHMNPDVYPEPTAFRPERFLGTKIDPYAWLPFGGGARRCLGMAFALFEMKLVLGTVVQRARLHRHGPRATIKRRGVTLSPSRGRPVVLEARG